MSNPHDSMEREYGTDGSTVNFTKSLSGTKADTTIATAGWYDISADADNWFWTGPQQTAVPATMNSRHQWAKDTVRVYCEASDKISMILSTGETGTGYISLVQGQ